MTNNRPIIFLRIKLSSSSYQLASIRRESRDGERVVAAATSSSPGCYRCNWLSKSSERLNLIRGYITVNGVESFDGISHRQLSACLMERLTPFVARMFIVNIKIAEEQQV